MGDDASAIKASGFIPGRGLGVLQIAVLSEMNVMFYSTVPLLVEDARMDANFHSNLKTMRAVLLKHPFIS
jgi:hypothetical protein